MRKIYDRSIRLIFIAIIVSAVIAINGGATALPQLAPTVIASETLVADTSWYTANPSASVFEISSAAQLLGLAELVNTPVNGPDNKPTCSSVTFHNKTIKITADIDFSTYYDADYQANSKNKGWSSIGSSSCPFRGNVDGQGHTINGLYGGGLFGQIGQTSSLVAQDRVTIANLGITNAIIKGTGATSSFGALANTLYAHNSTIENCYSTGSVTVSGKAGGLIGSLNGYQNTISNCYSTADVEGAVVGGLIGQVNTAVASGVVQETDKQTITNCYATGNVTGVSNYMMPASAGGVIEIINKKSGTIDNVLAAGSVNSDGDAGGIAGYMEVGGTITNATALNPSVSGAEGVTKGIVGNNAGIIDNNNCTIYDNMTGANLDNTSEGVSTITDEDIKEGNINLPPSIDTLTAYKAAKKQH